MRNRILFRTPLLIGLLLLPLGCGGDDPTDLDPPLVLQPHELCSEHADSAIPTFEDANLEAAIRAALSVSPRGDLTCGLLKTLTDLDAPSVGITSLVGMQNFSSLWSLGLYDNSITDISPLSGLTSLAVLSLFDNSITDVSALSGLTNLLGLVLFNNSITDVSALGGLTRLETLMLDNNSITDVSALSGLTNLRVLELSQTSIADISGLSGLTRLEALDLSNNAITDISALGGLTSLVYLHLDNNSLTDISALRGLTRLRSIDLSNNPDLTDIQPLVDNRGFGGLGSWVSLLNTSVSCRDVAALEANGVMVERYCLESPW